MACFSVGIWRFILLFRSFLPFLCRSLILNFLAIKNIADFFTIVFGKCDFDFVARISFP